MNFLSGVQRLRQESGVPGTGPSSVVGQTGQLQELVSGFQSAYEDIQNLHADWNFLRSVFTLSATSGDSGYTYTDAAITSFNGWVRGSFRAYLTATGVSDEQIIQYLPWDTFYQLYVFGTNRTQTGRPHSITIKPDKSLLLYPIPDATYTITGEYLMAPQELTTDLSTIVIPTQYQMAIVWRALMFFAAKSGEPDKYAHGEREYNRILQKMMVTELPCLSWGRPLA